ncbi:penicillin-binding transpeptidase domain-containing protein [Candidatus Spongiihabitans sp.]|uniref:penicillin-binding transpeptidase domain-containing protein n=1 Tax=Candidatus Spongiihabitans sp. TaxID=3101308 RepID=UPI003C7C8FC5
MGDILIHLVKCFWFKISSLIIILLASAWPAAMSLVDTEKGRNWGITEQHIAQVISSSVHQKVLPDSISIPGLFGPSGLPAPLKVKYTLDPDLQLEAIRLLKKYNPDYGVFVAISPDTGHILAMADSTRNSHDGANHGNLSLVNTFPAASISKIITAVAALNEHKANGSTVIPFNGKSTSLYKKNVFNHKKTKWTRNFTLDQAFANSVNTIFGRLGAIELGGETMLEYAYRLGFNGRFASDILFENGRIEIDQNDPWQVAEMASGYTTNNTLSPLHAAILATTALNGGKVVAPVIVASLIGPYGIPLYVHEQPALSVVMSDSSSKQLKKMMQTTITQGSARTSFRGFHKGAMANVNVGGKTGSLTGFKPRGKYDWFVGFGENGNQKIAFATLCINKEKWYVKSTRFAREILEFYFAPQNKSDSEKSA